MIDAPLPPTTGLLRAGVATAATGGLTVTLACVAAHLLADLSSAGTRGLEGGVALLAVTVGAVALGVVTAGCLLTAVSAAARLGGHTLSRLDAAASRLTPTLLRRAIAVGVGTGLLASVAGAATATEPDGWGSATGTRTEAVAVGTYVDLGWQVTSLPADDASPADTPASAGDAAAETADDTGPTDTGSTDTGPTDTGATVVDATVSEVGPVESPAATHDTAQAPESAPAPAPAERTPSAAPASNTPVTVTVRPGDTLWAIAAAHLQGDSGDAAIAASWPRWYAANLTVIGDDPNLIRPGQVLTAPGEVHS